MQGVPDNGRGRGLVIRDENIGHRLAALTGSQCPDWRSFRGMPIISPLSVEECRFGLVWLVARRRLQPSKRTMPKILLHEQ